MSTASAPATGADIAAIAAALRGTPHTVLIDDAGNIAQAAASGVRVVRVFHTTDDAPPELARLGLPGSRVDARDARRLFGVERASRVFALAEAPPPPRLEDLAARAGDIVALDGVRLTGNIGAVIRTTVAMGGAGVAVLDSGLRSVLDRRLVRASRGLVFSLPVVIADRERFLRFCARADLPLYAADARAELSVDDLARVERRIAIALGSERHGCSTEVRARATGSVAIPTADAVESLNVSVAAGIMLHRRQARNLPTAAPFAVAAG